MAARDQRQYSLYLTTGEKAMLDSLRVAEGDMPDLNKMIRRLIERAYDKLAECGEVIASPPAAKRETWYRRRLK